MMAILSRAEAGIYSSSRADNATTQREKEARARDLFRLLVFVVLNGVFLNLGFYALNLYLVQRDLGLKSHGTFGPLKSLATGTMGTDSNAVMLPALRAFRQNPQASPYDVVFFQNHQKFQYPLPSLLPYYLLQTLGASDQQLIRVSTVVSWLSVCGILLITFLIALKRISGECTPRATATIAMIVGIAGLLFYPLTRSYSLGQIQTVLTLGFTVAFYCWMHGREKAAGAIVGLMTLVKPQYALFLIWALLRKKFGAFAAGLACAGSGALIACLVFGVHNNLEYLKVIHLISLHGESFAANQSVNGLLNRLLFNGNNLLWDGINYAPYNPIVYFGTILTSLVLVGMAFFYPLGKRRISSVADFGCCILAATMASPVAWEHHYAILLPVFAWLWFGEYFGGSPQRTVFPIAIAYVLVSNDILPVSAFARIPVLNVLQTYLYFGALIVLILLLKTNNERPNQALSS